MKTLLIQNTTKATFFNDGYNAVNFLQDVDILIRDGIIEKIDYGIPAPEGAKVIDGTGKLVFPGMINCWSQSLLSRVSRMITEDWNYSRFDDTPLYARAYPIVNIALDVLSDEALSAILELSVYEAVRSGTTMTLEYCTERELPIYLALCKKYDLRTIAFPILRNTDKYPEVDSWGNYSDCLQKTDEAVKISRLKKMIEAQQKTDQCVGVGVGSVETTDLSLMKKAADLACEMDTFMMGQINVTKRERTFCEERYHTTPAAVMINQGICGSHAILAGNLLSDHEERQQIRQAEANAVITAQQSLLDAMITPFIGFLIDDVTTMCGSGRCSPNMLKEMYALTLSGKIESGLRHQMAAHDAFYASTVGPGKMLGINTGQVEEGFMADLVIIDISKPQHIPFTMPVAEIVYAADASDITHVIRRGKTICKDGIPLGADERLKERAAKAFEHLWDEVRKRGAI